MEGLLIQDWLQAADAIPILDEASVALARERARAEASRLGLDAVRTGSLANIASELAHNQLAHARHGFVAIVAIERDGIPGVEVVAADAGDGIADPRAALAGREPSIEPSAKRSLGVGLAAVRELSDEIDVDVRIGEGTCVRARKFASAVERGAEVGVFGRACEGEKESGDGAAFERRDGMLAFTVVDGLGHGPAARAAANVAIATFRRRAFAPSPEAVLLECHESLAGTRGAVMLAATLDRARGLVLASVGNVAAHLYGPARAQRFGGTSFVLGGAGRIPPRALLPEHAALGARDLIVVFSDGVTSRADLSSMHDLLREHPVVVAQHVVEAFGRTNDDVTVMVVG